MTVSLKDMKLQLTGKEERALFSQFKLITNNNIPKQSEATKTLIGLFDKEQNQTTFKWGLTEDDFDSPPEINYDVAMENLKNSTI